MKGEFKVGQRVAVYIGGSINIAPLRKMGKIIEYPSFNSKQQLEWLRVKYDDDSDYSVHRKQCRFIKPKKKPREFWVNVYESGLPAVHLTKDDADRIAVIGRTECILVREVVGK